MRTCIVLLISCFLSLVVLYSIGLGLGDSHLVILSILSFVLCSFVISFILCFLFFLFSFVIFGLLYAIFVLSSLLNTHLSYLSPPPPTKKKSLITTTVFGITQHTPKMDNKSHHISLAILQWSKRWSTNSLNIYIYKNIFLIWYLGNLNPKCLHWKYQEVLVEFQYS